MLKSQWWLYLVGFIVFPFTLLAATTIPISIGFGIARHG
jgi:hypothetical protein